MKKLLNPLSGSISGIHLFCISIYAIFITCFFLHEGSKIVSFELTDLSSVYYSEGTSYGVDIGLRVKWMYRFLIFSAVLFVGIFIILKRVFKNSSKDLIRYDDLLIFSAAGIILCIMRVFGTDSTHVLSSLFFLFVLKLVLVIFRDKFKIPKLLLHPGIFNLSISFSFLLLFGIVFLFGTSDLVHKNYSTILFIGTILFLSYYVLCVQRFKISSAKATSILLPLTTIPLLAVLSVEYFFYKKLVLSQTGDHFRYFIILFFISTLVITALLFFYRKKRIPSLSLYKRFIVPSLLIAYVVITAYEPVIENIPDMFEPANVLNSSLRVFEFGQIPILDFMSSHMLSEQWFTYVYSFIFGFHNDLSSLTYGFLTSLIFVYVQYILLKHLFKKSSYAIAFIFLFPLVNELFHPSVIIAVLPLFLTKDLFEGPSPWKLFKILLACCLIMAWRIDTGVVAIFGTIIFLPLMYFIYPEKIPFKVILKGKSYFILFGLLIFGITCILRGPKKIVHSLQMFYHYVGGSQSHGHQHIFQSEAHQFYLHHIIYPLLAVAFCLWAIYLLRTKYHSVIFKDGFFLTTSLFLFILYMIHLQRGLVRHGYAENTDDAILSVFPMAIAFLITFWLAKELPVQRFTMFFGSSFGIYVLIKYFPIQMGKIPIENGITGKRFYNIENPFDGTKLAGRVIADPAFADDNYTGLKKFMDEHLTKDQTFLDISNTSMLYYYCKRRIPGYFNQNMENTIDDHLHFELLKELDPKKVPMIIFSSYPKNVNDAMDNIPNVMRHYILAEYAYAHYKPIGYINHKNIWVTPQLANNIKEILPLDPSTFKAHTYDYKLMAEYLGYYYTKKNTSDLMSMFSQKAETFATYENTYMIKPPAKLCAQPHCFLKITFKQKDQEIKPYTIQVDLLNHYPQVLGSFTFARRDKVSNVYMLRLSNHYLWHLNRVSLIRLPKDPDILSIELLTDNRPEYKTTNSH